ncbi:MAG TPA: CHASE domain-containing protein, partial [Thermoanaerobaculaceae bacterium]|nr:CHASE domain-containing protein [Thermoanaerobaculaceae bacterium]
MVLKSRGGLVSSVIILALLGSLVGLAAHRALRRADDRRIVDRFAGKVAERASALESEISDARRLVIATAAFLSTSNRTTSSEFTRFALELMARGSAIQALEWVPLVPLRERGQHEAEARSDVGASYTITERTGTGRLVPAAAREEYFPVRFVEPLGGNVPALGFDLGSDPVRLSALTRAAETGTSAISHPVRLVQETAESTGFLLAVPVFRASAEENGGRLLSGFAVGAFRVEDVLSALFPDRGVGGLRDMYLELVDDRGVFHASPPPEGGHDPAGAVLRHEVHLDGQVWTLIARPTPAYLTHEAGSRAGVIGFGVFLGYELLLALALTAHRWWGEKARREKAEFAQAVIHSVREGVLVADAGGRMIAVNPAARLVLGSGRSSLPPAEWSRAFGLFVPGTDQHIPTEDLPLLRAIHGEDVPETDVFVRNAQVPEGAWASVTGAPLKDPGGKLLGGVVVFRDISEQKRAQELSQRLSNAVEQAADSVFITDCDGVIEYVNPAFEATTGYSRTEAVGQTPKLLKSGLQLPEYYATLWSSIARGEPFKGTVINRKKSGEHFYAEQTITPMTERSSGKITHFVSVMRDMTERIKLQEREIEMRLGASVQQKLFPQEPPRLPGYDIAGAVAPASATCGDYYDFVPLPDGRLAIGIADVSGHGVGAALIMTATRAYLRSLASTLTPLDKLAGELNRLLFADLEEHYFVTMTLVLLDGASGTLNWANFGHPSGYVLDRSGAVRAELKSCCQPLGVFPNLAYTQAPAIALEAGDTLVLLTDGILEATSAEGREFGRAAVLDVVK